MSENIKSITELRAMEQAATPGPWTAEQDVDECCTVVIGHKGMLVGDCCTEDNAALIAATRNALPHLLAIAEAAEQWDTDWMSPDGGQDSAIRACGKVHEIVTAARAAGLYGGEKEVGG